MSIDQSKAGTKEIGQGAMERNLTGRNGLVYGLVWIGVFTLTNLLN